MSEKPAPQTEEPKEQAPAAAPAHVHGPNCSHGHSHAHGHSYAQQPFIHETPKLGRNDPCSCGSGKKFKKCCG